MLKGTCDTCGRHSDLFINDDSLLCLKCHNKISDKYILDISIKRTKKINKITSKMKNGK